MLAWEIYCDSRNLFPWPTLTMQSFATTLRQLG
jgi:hypothetical protein